MKLFTKYTRINLLATVVIFLLACVAFLFVLRYIFIHQVDEDLEIEQKEILGYIKKYNRTPEVMQMHDQQTYYQQADTPLLNQSNHFQTVSLHYMLAREDKLFRELRFNVTVNNQLWLVTVRKSLDGTEDLVHSVILITVCTVLLILIATFFINRFLLHKLWHPFYNTLHTIKQFNVGDKQPLHFKKSNIDEFDLLNSTLEQR